MKKYQIGKTKFIFTLFCLHNIMVSKPGDGSVGLGL
jgi:hypothetical protein